MHFFMSAPNLKHFQLKKIVNFTVKSLEVAHKILSPKVCFKRAITRCLHVHDQTIQFKLVILLYSVTEQQTNHKFTNKTHWY